MSRQTKPRKLNNTIAVIADGKTERWYLESVKAHYRHDSLKGIHSVVFGSPFGRSRASSTRPPAKGCEYP